MLFATYGNSTIKWINMADSVYLHGKQIFGKKVSKIFKVINFLAFPPPSIRLYNKLMHNLCLGLHFRQRHCLVFHNHMHSEWFRICGYSHLTCIALVLAVFHSTIFCCCFLRQNVSSKRMRKSRDEKTNPNRNRTKWIGIIVPAAAAVMYAPLWVRWVHECNVGVYGNTNFIVLLMPDKRMLFTFYTR